MWYSRHFLCLLAQFGPGVKLEIVLELCLAARAANEVVHTFIFDYNVSLAAIDAFAAYRVFEYYTRNSL